MKDYERRPDPPYAVVIDLVEGCNLRCNFCGINGIRHPKKNDYKNMELDTLHEIVDSIADAGWVSRIEVGSHGEPTMHPHFYTALATIRERLPKASIMVTTNGTGFMKDTVDSLNRAFDYGANCIGLDEYEYVNIYKKVRAGLSNDAAKIDFEVDEYPANKSVGPNQKWEYRARQLVLVQDISLATTGTKASLTNHCGSAAPLNFKRAGKRCAKPFREITIRWDGNVAICCNTWEGVYKCGNILEDDLEDIWRGKAFRTARRFLYHGMREMAPCYGCDNVSYRSGFLPDRKGLKDVPMPTQSDYELWDEYISCEPLAVHIKTPWED